MDDRLIERMDGMDCRPLRRNEAIRLSDRLARLLAEKAEDAANPPDQPEREPGEARAGTT